MNQAETTGPDVAQFRVNQNCVLDFAGVLAHPDEASQLRHNVNVDNEPNKVTLSKDPPSNVRDNEGHSLDSDETCSPITPQMYPLTQFLFGHESELDRVSSEEASQGSGMDARVPSSASSYEIPANQMMAGSSLSSADEAIGGNIQIVPGNDFALTGITSTDLLLTNDGKTSSTQDSGKHRQCRLS